jgi:hypothetical protein
VITGLRHLPLIVAATIAAALPPQALGDTQHYSSDTSFSSYSYQEQQGTRDADGGCEFTGPAITESGADTVSLGADEVSYDPDTCRTTYRVGTLTEGWGDSPPETEDTTQDDSGTQQTPGLQEPEPRQAPCRPWLPCDVPAEPASTFSASASSAPIWYPRKELYSSIAWEEPFQLDVNKTEVWLNFRSTDTCAAAGRTYHRARNSWRWGTGWRRTHSAGGIDAYCTYVARWNNARFVNDIFCDVIYGPGYPPAPQTRTRMWPNRAIGLPAGRHRPYRVYSKAGGCSDLLHVELRWKVRRL